MALALSSTAFVAATTGARARHCAFCASMSTDERERRLVLRLLALLEHPHALLPPDLALRLGLELLAPPAQRRSIVCEPIGDERQ